MPHSSAEGKLFSAHHLSTVGPHTVLDIGAGSGSYGRMIRSLSYPAGPSSVIPERDRWGRPMVVPLGETEAVAYTRATTFASAPEDGYVLDKWTQHQLMVGLAARPDLVLSAYAHRDNWGRLNEIADEALLATEANTRATVGTALHLLAEQVDAGAMDWSLVPEPYKADLEKYQELTAGWIWVAHEEFRVWDRYRVAGTADRRGYDPLDGQLRIADLKFGRIDSSPQKVSIQLTGYAEGVTYDLETHERGPEDDCDRERAVVIHIPQAENEADYFGKRRSKSKTLGEANLHYVNLETGRAGAALADTVRSWRRKQPVFTPYE